MVKKASKRAHADDLELEDDEPEVTPLAFTQTAHSLAPANAKSLMSVMPNSEATKRPIVPISAAMVTREYSYPVTFTGGVSGDETLATANATDPYSPKTLTEGMAFPGVPNSVVPSESITGGQALTSITDYTASTVVNSPRGWIDPQEPYNAAPVSPADDPTLASIAPNTAVSGAGNPPMWCVLTGTKFTPWSSVETGNVVTPYSRYRSPTRIDVLMDPRSSAGIVVVKVIDHGVKTAGVNFTFT